MTSQQLALKLFPGVTPDEIAEKVTALPDEAAKETLEQFRANAERLQSSLRAGFGHAVLLRKMGEKEQSDEALKNLVARATADRSHPQGQAFAQAGRALHGNLPPEEPQAPRERPERADRAERSERGEKPARERAPGKERSFEAKIGQAQLALTPGGVRLDDQRPELRRLRLTSPLKAELTGPDASVSFYVHAARDEKGLIQITPMHPFAAGDSIRADVVEGTVVMGPWTIPVSEFGPGSSAADGPVRLVALESGVGYRKWRVESDPSLGQPEAFFTGLTKRGGAALRSKTGTNLVWDFEAHPPAWRSPIELGAVLRFRYGVDGARVFARDVEPVVVPEGESPAVPEGTPLRQVLFPNVPDAVTEKPAEKAADKGEARPERPERQKKERPQESLSPSTAAHLAEAALLRGERGAFEHLSSARTSDRGEQELFEKARWHLASSAGRSGTVTELVVARVNAFRKMQGKRVAEGPAYGLVYLHTTSGEAKPLGGGRGGNEKGPEDELSKALRGSPEFTVAESIDTFFRRHAVLWDTTVALGDLGYRVIEVDVRRGITGLVLASPSAEPARLAIAFVYEEGFETRERFESFLKKHNEKKEALAVVATRMGPLHGANTGVLAARFGAAFAYVRHALPPEGLTELLANAKSGAGTVPSPVHAFPTAARDLQESQLVARPEVVTRLVTALDAGRRPVAVYALPRSGRASLARLAGMQGREPWFIDFRARARELTDNPSGLIDELRGRTPTAGSDREYFLALDGFDFLATVLASADAAVATQFVSAISDAAASMRVLCLGVDPAAIQRVLPGNNPLVDIPRFRFPYLSRAEARELVTKLAGALRVERALEDWVVEQSGGHPGVLRGLLQAFADAQFGKDTARISLKDPLRLHAALAEALLGAGGAAQRADILASVLTAGPAVESAWRLATEALKSLPAQTTTEAVLEIAARLSLGAHAQIVLETVLDWGLLRTNQSAQVEAGIPLLRTHLRLEAGLPTE